MAANIIIDCERMKYPNTGLYHFCYQLGRALLQQPHSESLQFFLPPNARHVFGNNASALLQRPLHKFRMPALNAHTIWHATHQGTAYFPTQKNIPVVLTVHDLNFLYDSGKPSWKKKSYLQALQKKVNRASYITAISQFTLQELKQHVWLGNKPAVVVYNGCNIQPLDVLQPPVYLPKKPFLFTIGVSTAKKNFHVLPCLLQNNNYELLIAGNTPDAAYRKQIQTEARQYGVADRLVFTGGISENDKQWYYRHCTAFLFPSLAEGFGLPVVEAMYFGKPVFLSTHTSLPEIGGPEAYYFDSFAPGAMQRTLEQGLEHYNRAQPGEAIRDRAGRFSWQKAAEAYWQLYRQLNVY